ncbi:MarR family winged helix-turn-helix transcriptional regulator [Bacillus sp. 1NLA3E]|uniref:MarR family winged helix-turn-helix transcriptional regulator n=1 Tax=Bacillus sp. 1NLA3E TaxID=666686 RepID=UPI000247E862|nr:MarR family transcriptional regulator [Bacillus sp. 1NLA3E]AGK55885.1 MarR family transcriptional regulator [Bacillus sp. 1NLA3E]
MDGTCSNKPYLAIMQTSKAIQEQIRIEMSKHRVSITEFAVLEVLFLKGKQTIQQIAQSILIASSSMTYVVDKLEQKGLLKRSACPEDRRAIYVTITDTGNELMNHIMPMHRELVDYMLGSLDHDEAVTMVRLLEKVRNRAIS